MNSSELSTSAQCEKKTLGECKVCKEGADGFFFGANVCLPCKSFFVRTLNENHDVLKCSKGTNSCIITKNMRSSCKYCRFQKCLEIGMNRKVRPEVVEAGINQDLCSVCQDIANGIHFGALTCEGCKKFFRRSLKEYTKYSCRNNQECVINPRTRNVCRYCRYQKCLQQGMSKDVKIGRPRKEVLLSLTSNDHPLVKRSSSHSEKLKAETNDCDHAAIISSQSQDIHLKKQDSTEKIDIRNSSTGSSSDNVEELHVHSPDDCFLNNKNDILFGFNAKDFQSVNPSVLKGNDVDNGHIKLEKNNGHILPNGFIFENSELVKSKINKLEMEKNEYSNSALNTETKYNGSSAQLPWHVRDELIKNEEYQNEIKFQGCDILQQKDLPHCVNDLLLERRALENPQNLQTSHHQSIVNNTEILSSQHSTDSDNSQNICYVHRSSISNDSSDDSHSQNRKYSNENPVLARKESDCQGQQEEIEIPKRSQESISGQKYGRNKEVFYGHNEMFRNQVQNSCPPFYNGERMNEPLNLTFFPMKEESSNSNIPNFNLEDTNPMHEMESSKKEVTKDLKHKIEDNSQENVCQCKKLRRQAIETLSVPIHVKMLLHSKINEGITNIGGTQCKDDSPVLKMMEFMNKNPNMSAMKDNISSTPCSFKEGTSLNPNAMLGISNESSTKIQDMMSGGPNIASMQEMMSRGPDIASMQEMMSRGPNMMASMREMMSGGPNMMASMRETMSGDPNMMASMREMMSGDPNMMASMQETMSKGPNFLPLNAENESINMKSPQDFSQLFDFNKILENCSKIKCPSCSSNELNKIFQEEVIDTDTRHHSQADDLHCFIHGPPECFEESALSPIPPSLSNCICLKDKYPSLDHTATNQNDLQERTLSIQDIHIKHGSPIMPTSSFSRMLEKMMDKGRMGNTLIEHRHIHPSSQNCTDTIDRIRKLLKFFGIEEIEQKSNATFDQHVFNDEYWLKPKLPDENIVLNRDSIEMLETVISAYNHFITIMHEKVSGSPNPGQQFAMDIVRKRTIRNLSHWITFVKTIPNFVDVYTGDQFTIVRLAGIMGIMLAAAFHQYDATQHNFTNFYSFEFPSDHPHYTFRHALLDFGKDIQILKCDFVEAAMTNACMAVATDYPSLEYPESISHIRVKLLEAFRAYTTAKYGTPNRRIEEIFEWMPRLRDLGIWNYRLSFSTCFSFEEAASNSSANGLQHNM